MTPAGVRHLTRAAFERGDQARAQARDISRAILAETRHYVDTGRFRRVLPQEAVALLSPHPRADRIRVLLVEDDPDDAQELARLLRNQLQIEVVVAESVEGAAEELSRGPFSLAVVDWSLGDGLGVEVVELARHRNPDLPVVVMSSVVGEELDAIEDKVGAQGRFDKTTNPAALVETVRRLVTLSL